MPGSIVERYGGRECEMEEFSGNLYTIVFDDGQICYADTDELSPLPAAPLNEETE
jgi:hypothetical protein